MNNPKPPTKWWSNVNLQTMKAITYIDFDKKCSARGVKVIEFYDSIDF